MLFNMYLIKCFRQINLSSSESYEYRKKYKINKLNFVKKCSLKIYTDIFNVKRKIQCILIIYKKYKIEENIFVRSKGELIKSLQ